MSNDTFLNKLPMEACGEVKTFAKSLSEGSPMLILSVKKKNFKAEISINDFEELIFHFFPITGRRFPVTFKPAMETVFTKLMTNFEEKLTFGKVVGVMAKNSLESSDSYFVALKRYGTSTVFLSETSFKTLVLAPLDSLDDILEKAKND